MEVFNRLFQIFRSNIDHGRDRTASTGGEKASNRHDRARNYNGGNGKINDNADPRIAAYFANLEIPYGSDLETVRGSWKRLVKQFHPDLHSSDPEKQKVANELVQGLNIAFDEIRKYYISVGSK
jgi:hypothetical protein